MDILRGRRACGGLAFEARIERLDRRYCACGLCRGVLEQAVVTGLVLETDGLRWRGGQPVVHASVRDADRMVCGECGSTLVVRESGGAVVLDVSTLEPHRAIGCRSHVLAGAPASADFVRWKQTKKARPGARLCGQRGTGRTISADPARSVRSP